VQAYDEDGTPLDQAQYAAGQQHALAGWYLAAGSILHDLPDDLVTLQDWVERGLPKPEGLSDSAEKGFRYQSLISTEYVCAADAHEIDWSLNEQHVSLTGGDHLLHGGGYNVITDHLAAGLDIRTGQPVSHITSGTDGAVVTTNGEAIACSRVVVTVPLGVLKSGAIRFEPPLPAEKTGAISRIGFGNYEKLAMRFDKFYWPKEPQRINYMSTGEMSLFHAWLNVGHYTGEPILVSYHAGKRARHLNQLSDGELIEQTVTVMARLFGGDIPAPIGYARTRWQHDPFSLGSYSFDQIGQRVEDRKVLAQPVRERLFFAGEATHPHFHSTVHGAYETGVRAAREILLNLGHK
jgi:monoamine oxidase